MGGEERGREGRRGKGRGGEGRGREEREGEGKGRAMSPPTISRKFTPMFDVKSVGINTAPHAVVLVCP